MREKDLLREAERGRIMGSRERKNRETGKKKRLKERKRERRSEERTEGGRGMMLSVR